jgi:tetratricopeptide (TPR) repeat protein
VHPPDQAPRDVARDPALPRGTEIGRFIVLGLLGSGAMGEVYAAFDPELDRKIAIKLLRGGGTEEEAVADQPQTRLLREARAIAKIAHPNVVVVYDVGTFRQRVFMAMEFVEGHTLRYWLERKSRGIAEILQVFLAAGRGLAAAHERGIVHRDFKPENVMVNAAGQARVTDFGLARLGVDPNDADRRPPPAPLSARAHVDPGASARIDTSSLALTQEGAIVGTPAYMSPEQFLGAPTDARTDQFSFCVALYEALSGKRPFLGATLQALTDNVVAGRLRAETDGTPIPASIRHTLARGLQRDASARFPSMAALIAELEVEGNLLGARGFAGDAAAKLVGIWEAPDGPGTERTAAKEEIRRAFLATGKPYAAAGFEAMSRILDRFARRWIELYVDCCEATHLRGEQTTEILDLRMAALRDALGNLRALCLALREATPDTVENADRAAHALGTLERCADVKLLHAIVHPPADAATRARVEELQARLAGVRALANLGRIVAGIKEVAVLEEDARRVAYAPLLAEVLFTAGAMYLDSADFETAARVLEDAAWTAELCRHDEVAADAASFLVYVTGHIQSRFEAGELWSRHAETILRRMGGHDLAWGWLLNSRGAMRATQGRLHEAVEDMRNAIAAKEKVLGPNDPDAALSLTNVATYLDELGDIAGAAEYARRSVAIMAATLGLDHPKAAIPLTNYADLLNRLGRHAEARDPAERALAVFERQSDSEGLYVTYPLTALGISDLGLRRFQDALSPLERAVRIREARETIPARRAEVFFALAQALNGAGPDPDHPDRADRARALALRARDEYRRAPPTPATARELAAINGWITAVLAPEGTTSEQGLTKVPITEPG